MAESDQEDNLNGTYTINQMIQAPNVNTEIVNEEQNAHHIVNIPVTPRDVDTNAARLPPVASELSGKSKLKRGHSKKKLKRSKTTESVEVSRPEPRKLGSDSSVGTYVIPPSELAYSPAEADWHTSSTVIESPPEHTVGVVRRRGSANKENTRGVFDDSHQHSKLKLKRFGKKKKRNKNEKELGVDLAVENVRKFVQEKFHQKLPNEELAGDEVDYFKSYSQGQLSVGRAGIGVSRTSIRSQFEFNVVKTRAFGRINFSKDAKTGYEPPFVCVSNTDSKEDLLELMLDQWKLPEPKLIVSIVGGAKRFKFAKSRVSALFKQGLLDIATTTGAWVLTPGSNTGVYKMVGSAVKDYLDATGSTSMNDIVLLGIAAWGSVAGRDNLVDETGNGKFPADYPTTDITGGSGTQPLEPHHSHFILVDDGSRNKFGGEIKWRAEFEKFLTEHVLSGMETKEGETDEVNIPLVTLLVNGGDGSFMSCSESLSVKIPLVAIAGSGRAAEVIVQLKQQYQGKATNWRPTKEQLSEIYQRVMNCMPKPEVISSLKIIAEYHRHISVFDFTHPGTSTDDIGLDRAILSALHLSDNMDVAKMKAQMRLALAWGRVDYARDDILNVNSPSHHAFMNEKSFLHGLALEALLEGLPVFVELLLENGLSLKEFVTEDLMENLYKQSMNKYDGYSRFVKTLFNSMERKSQRGCCSNSVGPDGEYMYQVGRLLKSLLGYTYPNIYKKDDDGSSLSYCGDKLTYKDPAQQIFLWAALFNKMDIARMFWKLSQDHIAGAIVGAAVMRSLARRSNHQEGIDITAGYLNNSMQFEMLANGILDCCWSKDRQYTSDMLVRESPNWGNTTVLSMAYHGEMEEFLAQSACYTKLNKIWRGDISLRTHWALIVFFAFVPLMAFLLKFVRKRDCDPRMDERQDDPVFIEDLTTDDAEDKSPPIYKPVISVTFLGKAKDEIAFLVAILRAIRSPLVKCIHYSIQFMVFLIVYALFLMTELKPYNSSPILANQTTTCDHCCGGLTIGCLEVSTYCFALANFLEEIRQIWFRDTRSMKYAKQKFVNWINDFWNKVDLLSYFLFIIAIFLRFLLYPNWFEWARWLFSFSFMVYFIRFTQIFYVVEQLGPKIIMIKKMMVDLLFFVIILLMATLCFGVITHAILSPEDLLRWSLIESIIKRPYFQMYGELFLEDYPGYRWLLLGAYMLLTNILLLNLLIAMFSYTFEQVQEKAEILWKYNYYEVVFEHFDRPYITFVGTLYTMLRHCRCSKQSALCGHSTGSDFRRQLDSEVNGKITKFVRVCMQKYLAQESKLQKENMVHKVTNTAQRLETVIGQLDDLKDDVMSQQPRISHRAPLVDTSTGDSKLKVSTQNIEKRMKNLETKLQSKIEKLSAVENKLDRITDLLLHSQQSQH